VNNFDREFFRRAARIPVQGMGLSADVYNPDLVELHGSLVRSGLEPDYLEIFKASETELARLRAALPVMRFAYHAEGLWLVDPEMRERYPWEQEITVIGRHTHRLGAVWANHECATKQFGGQSFGTYLPPLYTAAAAEVVAGHAELCQHRLDQWYGRLGLKAPLLLLELAPLTYFGFGDLPAAGFFQYLAARTSCGFVLDIGHLWTIWRYRERRNVADLKRFVQRFLESFPLQRILQLHVAGLGVSGIDDSSSTLPWWLDRHDAPIPAIAWAMLQQVLAHPGLHSLKGIALEVDTKTIPLILEEFRKLRTDFSLPEFTAPSPSVLRIDSKKAPEESSMQIGGIAELVEWYRAYAEVSGYGTAESKLPAPLLEQLDPDGLQRYQTQYFPHEVLSWGGELQELFSGIWEELRQRGITEQDFVYFWCKRCEGRTGSYDFFHIKLEKWAAFIREVAPDLSPQVDREVASLRRLHAEFSGDLQAIEGHLL
jgi:hypothetical protein